MKTKERKRCRRGNKGDSKFAARTNETSLQVGVTQVAVAESFTDPVAQICHPYDRTPLEREARWLSLSHAGGTQ